MSFDQKEQFFRNLHTHLPSLYNFARWLMRDADEANDVVHDALCRVFSKGNGNCPAGEMKAYLFTIIRRTYVNRLRRRGYEVTSADYPEEENIPAPTNSFELRGLPVELVRRDLNRALESLSDDYRAFVLLADVEGFSAAEIAKIMDVPDGTARSKLWRAHQKLRERLTSYIENKIK